MKAAALAAALALGAAVAGQASARSDDIPWGRKEGQACATCHFLNKPVAQSPALTLQGLPPAPAAGKTYRLVLSLTSPSMGRAGFLIVAKSPGGAAGTFQVLDPRTEADGDRLRSTQTGSTLAAAGAATWEFLWRAPARITAPISFSISANAADDDKSPLGDTIHLLERPLCAVDCP